jgi:undecaprenyl-diphosphatase
MSAIIQAIGRLDRNLFLTLNGMQHRRINRLIMACTQLGGLRFQTGLALILLTVPGSRALGLRLAVVQIMVTIIVQILKATVARVRPYNVLEGIVPFAIERDFSFPSGHTAASFTAALVVGTAIPALGALGLILAVLIGFSRIYIGVHYPLDVLAGGCCGTGITWLALGWLPF